MDGDIEFGDLQHTPPRTARRPDADLHYAVVPYGDPVEGELPVFVDLDVMREIETHASSDTSVELGGVLLGGHYEDDQGQPFVVITDCLRAQHYESTKGSFKFTHETWETITRQRDEFPEELQMVGWYHTHPGWGVFLSGMDLFICENFFDKPLDVAYVVDPCRGDRGMFQWTAGGKRQTRRTGGFYVTASRFREDELTSFVEQLSQRGPSMPSLPHGSSAPVVHITQPQPPAWQGIAVWGTLVAQFCLIALIGWRMLGPTSVDVAAGTTGRSGASQAQSGEADLQTEFIDRVLQQLRGTEEGFAERMQHEFARSRELEEELKAERRQNIALLREIDRSREKLQADYEKLETRLSVATRRLDALTSENEKLERQLAAIDKSKSTKKKTALAETDEAGTLSVPYLVGGGIGALALVFLGLAFFWRRRPDEAMDEAAMFGPPPGATDEAASDDDLAPPSPAPPAAPTARTSPK